MNGLMLAMFVWISAQTGLPVPTEMPTIVKLEPCELQHRVSPTTECGGDITVNAGYELGTLFLRSDWRSDDIFDLSTLLHELVHHAQYEAGMPMGIFNPCPGTNLEKPAYDAQIAWLRAAGVEPLKTMHITPTLLASVTSCVRPY